MASISPDPVSPTPTTLPQGSWSLHLFYFSCPLLFKRSTWPTFPSYPHPRCLLLPSICPTLSIFCKNEPMKSCTSSGILSFIVIHTHKSRITGIFSFSLLPQIRCDPHIFVQVPRSWKLPQFKRLQPLLGMLRRRPGQTKMLQWIFVFLVTASWFLLLSWRPLVWAFNGRVRHSW